MNRYAYLTMVALAIHCFSPMHSCVTGHTGSDEEIFVCGDTTESTELEDAKTKGIQAFSRTTVEYALQLNIYCAIHDKEYASLHTLNHYEDPQAAIDAVRSLLIYKERFHEAMADRIIALDEHSATHLKKCSLTMRKALHKKALLLLLGSPHHEHHGYSPQLVLKCLQKRTKQRVFDKMAHEVRHHAIKSVKLLKQFHLVDEGAQRVTQRMRDMHWKKAIKAQAL